MVIAGRQGQQLVSVGNVDAGIVDRRRPDLPHIFVEDLLIGQIDVIIVAEHARFIFSVNTAVKGRHHLILPLFVAGVKTNKGVLPAKALIGIPGKLSKHGTVAHMVPVDQIEITVRGASFIDEGDAAEGIRAVKGAVEIVFRPVRGVHHRIIDGGPFNGEPTEKVRILFNKRQVLRQRALLIIGKGRRIRYIGIRRDYCRKLRKVSLFLCRHQQTVYQFIRGEKKDGKQYNKRQIETPAAPFFQMFIFLHICFYFSSPKQFPSYG